MALLLPTSMPITKLLLMSFCPSILKRLVSFEIVIFSIQVISFIAGFKLFLWINTPEMTQFAVLVLTVGLWAALVPPWTLEGTCCVCQGVSKCTWIKGHILGMIPWRHMTVRCHLNGLWLGFRKKFHMISFITWWAFLLNYFISGIFLDISAYD